MISRVIFWVACLILLLPVGQLLLGVFAPVDTESWEQVREYLLVPAIWESIYLTVAVCVLSLLFGVPAAWCVSRFQFPGRRLFSVLLVLPLAVPPYVAAYISTDAREALIPWLVSIRENQGVEAFLLAERVHRFSWLSVMLAAVLYPYVFLTARAAFSGTGCRLADAGRTLGSGPWRSFFTISLPLARPALAAGLFLVAMETLNDYGGVTYFGVQTLTPTLFKTWFGLGDIESARRLAAWILIVILVLRFLEVRFRGRAGFESQRRPARPTQLPKRPVLIACLIACFGPVLVGFLYPCLTLLYWLSRTTGPDRTEGLIRATGHSLGLGLAVTALCLLAALVINGINRFVRSPAQDTLARIASVAGYASPGSVLAVAIFGTAAFFREVPFLPEFVRPWLISGSLLWLVYGLSVRYFAIAGQMTREGLASIPRGLDDSARLLGGRPFSAFIGVQLPLLRPALAGAGILVFIDVVKELPLSLLLRPFDFETLGTWTYGLVDQGLIFACAAPSLAIVAIGSIGLVVVELFLLKRS
ncbi:MAG: iron ABC transporter permease [Verrucomicrobiota bacterium]